jgi:hypothetical protein
MRLLWDDNHISVFREPSNNSNGNTVDPQGRLVTCEHRTRRVTRTELDGSITVIADKNNGKQRGVFASTKVSRHIHREFINRNPTDQQAAQMAKWVSLIVKFCALVFIIFVPTQYAIYLQLLGGIWIIQTLPSVVLGAYTRWFNDWALLVGWAVGIVIRTAMAAAANLTPAYPLQLAGYTFPAIPRSIP